jgi:O-acetyl-ADP-ribose deacetylase (regulator of RNase III)
MTGSYTEERGSILDSGCQVLVNPVNLEGVMGKGLALAFKMEYPGLEPVYQAACRAGKLVMGRLFVFEDWTGPSQPRYIVCLPTKDKWRGPSRIDYIVQGVLELKRVCAMLDVTSVAIPALGCGLGGLDWGTVEPYIKRHLNGSGLHVSLYPPLG